MRPIAAVGVLTVTRRSRSAGRRVEAMPSQVSAPGRVRSREVMLIGACCSTCTPDGAQHVGYKRKLG